MGALKIRDFIRSRPQGLVDDDERSGVAACHLVAPPGTAMRYDAVMPAGTHALSVHLKPTRRHVLIVEGEALIDGPLTEPICFLPAERRVESVITDGFDVLQIFMPCAWLNLIAQRFATPDGGTIELRSEPFVCADPVLLHLASSLIAIMREVDEAARLIQFRTISEAFATRLICAWLLIRHAEPRLPGGLTPAEAAVIRRYIEEHMDERLTVADLAAMAGLSVFHFSRAFKLATGLPPYRYLQQSRMTRAYDLLQSAHLPIGSVAAAVGYEDPSHFAGVFRRTFGLSPRRLRRMAYPNELGERPMPGVVVSPASHGQIHSAGLWREPTGKER